MVGCFLRSQEDVEPVEEYDGEGLLQMGTTAEGGVYRKTRKEDFTEYRRHESQSLRETKSMHQNC